MKVCPFRELCNYCNFEIQDICCMYETYRNGNFKICREKKVCPNYIICRDIINGNLKRKQIFYNVIPSLKELANIDYSVRHPLENFKESFIPRIEINRSDLLDQTKVIKDLGFNMIAISLNKLMSEKKEQLIKESYLENLHEKFNFHEKILLLTNIHDYYCIKIMKNIDQFIEELEKMKIDIITSLDANFYLDQPLVATLIQLKNLIDANNKLNKSNLELVGLIPPLNYQLFKFLVKKFITMGYKTICIPLAQLNKSKDSYRLKIVNFIQQYKIKNNFELLLISTAPKRKMRADCYSTKSWVLSKNHLSWKNKLKRYRRVAKEIRGQRSLFDLT